MLNAAPRGQVHLGATTVTFLPDGEVHLEPTVLFPASQPDGWAAYAPYLDDDGRLPVTVGSFLVRTEHNNLLIDLGLGAVDFEVPGMGSFRGGRLIDSLAAEGLRPSDIDTVVFTHLHHDHVGWTTGHAPAPGVVHAGAPAELTFREARHVVDRVEWDYWNGTAEVTGPDPDAVRKPLSSVIQFLDRDELIVPGVRAIATPGHTPGHTSVLVTEPGGDGQLLVLGDVMHTQAQVSETHWNFLLDVDAAAGTQTRRAVLQ
jgi:glyoxylase-like metal-dependent hydrolase (beta-lactamase superfamily II)